MPKYLGRRAVTEPDGAVDVEDHERGRYRFQGGEQICVSGLDAAPRFSGDAGQLARFAQGHRQLAFPHLHGKHHLRERVHQDADLVFTQRLMGARKIAVLDATGGTGQFGQRIEDHSLGREHQPRHDRHAQHGHRSQD